MTEANLFLGIKESMSIICIVIQFPYRHHINLRYNKRYKEKFSVIKKV